jgi:branched-chain amino acid transport system substrate-binding protein
MIAKAAGLAGLLVSFTLASPSWADISIGLAGPMTGSDAYIGEQFIKGATQAITDINAKGGVNGQKLTLVVGDDACDPKQARSVAEMLAERKVAVAIGHFCSSSSIPASEVYLENGILQISPGSTNPLYTERKLPNTYRVCGRDDQQGPTAAQYIKKTFPGKVVAIVHDKSTYGKGLADEVKNSLEKLGIKTSLYEAITVGEKDYSALVTKMKSVKADIVYFGGYITEAGLIIRQMHDQGLKATLMGGDALVAQELWSITGASGQGTLMTFSPDPRKLPANAALVKTFRDQKFEPEAYTLYAYAAIQAWTQAATKAKATDMASVTKVLQSTSFDTAIGPISFDAKGDVKAPGYVVYKWKDGTYDVTE